MSTMVNTYDIWVALREGFRYARNYIYMSKLEKLRMKQAEISTEIDKLIADVDWHYVNEADWL